MSSKVHRGKSGRGRRGDEEADKPGPPGRKPLAPPGRVEKPAKGYDRRDRTRDVSEGMDEGVNQSAKKETSK